MTGINAPNSRTTTVAIDDQQQLCAKAIGDQVAAAILLIAAATWSMDWWDEEFCRRLADRGRLIVRNDKRDTGRSAPHDRGGDHRTDPASHRDLTQPQRRITPDTPRQRT